MLCLFSPAKINLFLYILGKRVDGYHELSSLFQTISLGDHLDFALQEQDQLTCNHPDIPVDETNLILKAVHLFRAKTGLKQGLNIRLEKRIPMQAGLGGGSSNAATTLWAFNQLVGGLVSTEQLQEWSAEIGSDIPFFFSEGSAYCRGRGEIVYPIRWSSPYQSCWIVKLPIGLPTPEVYRSLCASPINASSDFYFNLENLFINNFNYVNDLEIAAFKLLPELQLIKEQLLNAGFDHVLMAGSGSAFFCLGNGELPDSLKPYSTLAKFICRPPSHWYSL